jgi:hypothetical protein
MAYKFEKVIYVVEDNEVFATQEDVDNEPEDYTDCEVAKYELVETGKINTNPTFVPNKKARK